MTETPMPPHDNTTPGTPMPGATTGPAAANGRAPLAITPAPAKPVKKEESFLAFLVKLVLLVVVFRSFVFSPFNIPSESMLPRLLDGDYLLAAKWPYGFTSYSLPFSVPLIPGHVFARQPKRGDIAIFKAPPANDEDYIKRVIGLPGDTIQMIHGQLHINGTAIPKVRQPDFINPVTANMIAAADKSGGNPCTGPAFQITLPDGRAACRYARYRETIPDGAGGQKSYDVLDMDQTPQDDTPPVLVPEGTLFMMGDNRDNSMDSRFPAVPGGGVGLVPQDNLVGRATVMMWSTDGSAEWYEPWTWFTAARWSRIGGTF